MVGEAIATPSAIPPQTICGSSLPCRGFWATLGSMLFSAGAQLSSRGLGLQESGAHGSSGCLLLYTGPGPPSRSGSEKSHIISMSTHSFGHPQTSCVPLSTPAYRQLRRILVATLKYLTISEGSQLVWHKIWSTWSNWSPRQLATKYPLAHGSLSCF